LQTVAVLSHGPIVAAPLALPAIARLPKTARKHFLILPEIPLYRTMDILNSLFCNLLRLCMQ